MLSVLSACGGSGENEKKPAKLTASPTSLQLVLGEDMTVGAKFIDDAGASSLASGVTWKSSDAAVATVTAGATGKATVHAVAAGSATVTVSGSGLSATISVTVSATALTGLTISPSNPTVALGTTARLTTMGVFSDGSSRGVNGATWDSSEPAIATIAADGTVTPVASGTTTITATLGTSTATTVVTVGAPVLTSIYVTPEYVNAITGDAPQLTAYGVFSDSSMQDITASVVWSSDTEDVATVDATGVAHAVGGGQALITATSGELFATATITVLDVVSISIEPADLTLPSGLQTQFVVVALLRDGSNAGFTEANWSSSDLSVAIIDPNGIASTSTPGTTTISATLGVFSASTTLTVTPAELMTLQIVPAESTMPVQFRQRFTVYGTYTDGTRQDLTATAVWNSGDPAIAAFDDNTGINGRLTALQPGPVTLYVSSGFAGAMTTLTVTTASLTMIEVTPHDPTLPAGASLQFVAVGYFDDGTTLEISDDVTWSSGAPSVASVDVNGLASAHVSGTASISATRNSLSNATTLTVPPPTLTGIDVTPATPSIPVLGSVKFIASGHFSDGSTQDLSASVTWASGTPATATIAPGGLATALATGTSAITATSGAVSGAATLTVNTATLSSMVVTPNAPQLPLDESQQLTAVGTFSDGSQFDVTRTVSWSSATPASVSVTNSGADKGTVTGHVAGTINVTATANSITATVPVTVMSVSLTSLAIIPSSFTLALNRQDQLHVQATYSDGSTGPMSEDVTWSSSDDTIVSVSNTPGSKGRVTAGNLGTATITVTRGTHTATASGTIVEKTLDSITITPSSPMIQQGLTQQLTAMGSYSDGSSLDITATVNWNSTAPNVAAMSSTTPGLVTTQDTGSATITAELDSAVGLANVTVF